ncbi:MAG TPA: hypothetical protein VF720_02385 [Candidatus Eisenbacteria bacterium]
MSARPLLLAVALVALVSPVVPGLVTPARAVPFDNTPKILLHLKPVTAKNQCASGITDCRDAVTSGLISTPGDPHFYYALVLGARGNLATLGGFQFGINYDDGCAGGLADHDQIDILGWTLCGMLEFSSPSPRWPSPGSGNLITWDAINSCQTGEHAVAGYFYLSCYNNADVLDIIPRPVDARAVMANCTSVETTLPASSLGSLAFSASGATLGCNSCDGPCPEPPPRTGCPVPPIDHTPPGAVIMTLGTIAGNSIEVYWHAPGDDGFINGPATSYDVRWSTAPITPLNFSSANQASNEPVPAAPGTQQGMTVTNLQISTTYYIAMKSADEQRNISDLSNVVTARTVDTSGDLNAATSLALHAIPVGPGGCAAGRIPDCRDANTIARLLPDAYLVYLLAGEFAEIGGIEVGIQYSGGAADGAGDQAGVDVYNWTSCADLQFPSPTPAWPAPGSGNLMTWQSTHCQFPPTTVAGYFYVGAYSDDEFRLTIRPGSGQAAVATCNSVETPLPPDALGSVRFTSDGKQAGINPCGRGTPTPVRMSTWSRIKNLGEAKGTKPTGR